GLVETPETFAVELTALRGPAALTVTNVIVKILDNDYGIEFTTNQWSVGESEGVVTLAVHRRDDGTNGVTVDFATAPGSATPGTDYVPRSGTLFLPPGTEERTFTIPILNDTLVESDETFRVFLSYPTGGASFGSLTSVVVRILDDDRPGSLDTGFFL